MKSETISSAISSLILMRSRNRNDYLHLKRLFEGSRGFYHFSSIHSLSLKMSCALSCSTIVARRENGKLPTTTDAFELIFKRKQRWDSINSASESNSLEFIFFLLLHNLKRSFALSEKLSWEDSQLKGKQIDDSLLFLTNEILELIIGLEQFIFELLLN